MNLCFQRPILLAFAVLGGLAFSFNSWAASYCQLSGPSLGKMDGNSSIQIKLNCSDKETNGSIAFPPGEIYVGATLYKLASQKKGDKYPVVIDQGREANAEEQLDLPAQAITVNNAETAINFPVAKPERYTHVVIAAWSKKEACENCPAPGYTLGPVDDELKLPLPLDAFPRPNCDVKKMTESGFFQEARDISGYILQDEFQLLYMANDCWSKSGLPYGLGYTVRRWRAYPLVKLSQ